MGEKLHLNRITMNTAPSSRIILIYNLININLSVEYTEFTLFHRISHPFEKSTS